MYRIDVPLAIDTVPLQPHSELPTTVLLFNERPRIRDKITFTHSIL